MRKSRYLCTPVALSVLALSAADCDGSGPDSPISVAWSVQTSAVGWRGVPAIQNGVAVVQDGPALLALDVSTGEVQWRRQLRAGVDVNAEGIAIAGGRVFTAGGDSVYALSFATGARLWAFLPDDQAAACDLGADNDAVFVGTRSHRVYSLNAQTGAVLWSVDIGPTWQFLGVVVGTRIVSDTVFVTAVQFLNQSGGLRAGHVFALSKADGSVLWHFTSPGQESEASGAPGIANGSVLVSDAYGLSFFSLNRNSGQERWRVRTAAGFLGALSTPAVLSGRVYAGSQAGVYAADLATGSLLWSNLDLIGVFDVALCGDVLVVQNQMIQAVDPGNGDTLGGTLLSEQANYPTSRLAVEGRNIVVVGLGKTYGLRC